MLKKNADPRVQTYAVWVPMSGGTENDVAGATATFHDSRVRHFWDSDGFTLRAFAPVLALPVDRKAWDVYLIYKAGARWDGAAPPAPDYWMHQLNGVDNGPFLDAEVLGKQLARVLAAQP